jgi:hypothetical protein
MSRTIFDLGMIAAMSREACLELARRTGRDPDAVVEDWLERAAIREFEGGQPRADAERDALADLRAALLGAREPERAGQVIDRKGPRSAGADAGAGADAEAPPGAKRHPQ